MTDVGRKGPSKDRTPDYGVSEVQWVPESLPRVPHKGQGPSQLIPGPRVPGLRTGPPSPLSRRGRPAGGRRAATVQGRRTESGASRPSALRHGRGRSRGLRRGPSRAGPASAVHWPRRASGSARPGSLGGRYPLLLLLLSTRHLDA